jgi:hypothetical protein
MICQSMGLCQVSFCPCGPFYPWRQKLLLQQQQYASESANHVKGGFGGLARTVSERWRKLDLAYKMKLDNLVDMDKIRHARETKAWNTAKALQVTYIKKSGEDEVTAKIHEIAQEEATAPTSAPVITDWDSHSTASKASSFKDDFEPLPFDAPVKESSFQFNESTWNSLSDILHSPTNFTATWCAKFIQEPL